MCIDENCFSLFIIIYTKHQFQAGVLVSDVSRGFILLPAFQIKFKEPQIALLFKA